MLSTLRVLRNRSLASTELITKASSAGIHVCVKLSNPRANLASKLKKNLQFASLPLSSKFMSTDLSSPPSSGSTASESQAEIIPDPPIPTPLEESINLQVLQKEEDFVSFLEVLTEAGKNVSQSALDLASPIPELQGNEEIPAPPKPVDLPVDNILQPNGEPTFESLGLGGWSPVGIVEKSMEFLHINLDIPWWGTIVIGTIVVRTLLFPLVILAQRNAAKMNNNLPGMQAIQLKMSEARERGDRLDAARYAQEMMVFMKEKELNPFKNMLVPLAQAPLFISFFMGLRAMANLPVESLRTGGLLWFVDLTLPDQFYILPIITSATLLITIEVGTDAGRMNSGQLGMMKYVLRALPIVIFPFTLGFPAAILVYWTSTNFISLIQVSILKIPRVRKLFKIDPLIVHDNTKLPIKEKGFVKGVKDSWTNMKITRELEDRHRVDEMNFMQAGRGAVKKTYKYDPTKRPPRSISAIQVKKRD